MWRLFLVCLTLLVGCGSSLLKDGTYNVHLTITSTTDPFYTNGEEMDVQWKITEEDGTYSLVVVDGGDTKFKGKEQDGAIEIYYYQDLGAKPDCPSDNTLTFSLNPNDNREAFTGDVTQEINLCTFYNPNTLEHNSVNWFTALEAKGTLD